jgi:hypothetical protein
MRSLGAPVAGVRAQGATSPFDGVTVGLGGAQMGCVGAVQLARSVGAWSAKVGTGPIDVLVSVAQSIRCGSRADALCAV